MYLMSYAFHDDGTIAFRLGATGQNLPGQRQEAHVHSGHWRIDIDLVDGQKNSAMLMRHLEDPASLGAEDLKEPFLGGMEGGVDWNPKEFTMIRVESERKNARGEAIAYDLMPMRSGTARHNEPFTHHDLWVSRSHPERPLEYLFINLPNIVKDEEAVEQADIVLWCNSAVHHEPRNEDGKPNSGRQLWPGDDAWEGSALVMWSGFDLRPRNLFDRTPFYPYSPAPPPRQAANRRAGTDADEPSRPSPTAAEPPGNRAAPEPRK
jgi:Cu2+-containing amine oxidase